MAIRNDLSGKKFGRYTVLEYSFTRNHNSYWKCLCDCGTIKDVNGSCLVNGHTRSCGCLLREMKGTNWKHGDKKTRIYREWNSMRNRCICKTNTSYPRYGGRGISVCKEWDNYLVFKEWAINNGYNDTLTIDRIDPNGDYKPENCRWVTPEEQNLNRRNTIIVEYNGVSKPLLIWCNELGLDYHAMWWRIRKNNWSIEKAFNTPR